MEDNEPLGIPSDLLDSNQLSDQRSDKAPTHLPSQRVITSQWKDPKVLPPRLPPDIMPDIPSEVATVVYMDPVSVDFLHITVHRGWYIALGFSLGRVLLMI